MLSQRKHNDTFQQSISSLCSSRVYGAVVIFAMSHIVTCIGLPTSQSLFQSSPQPKKRDSNVTVLDMGMTNVKNKDNYDEDNYFHPDTILFHPSDRKNDNFDIDTNNSTYLSFSESASVAAPKYPIKPITLNPVKLPKTDDQPKLVKHVLRKEIWPVDLVSRKIFVRGEK